MRPAFLMADSLVALIVVALGINLVIVCEQQIIRQQRDAQLKLAAARLGKEASDQYAVTRQHVTLSRAKMQAQTDQAGVRVYYQGRQVLRVRS